MSQTIGDGTTPLYEFEWSDGRTVRSDEVSVEENDEFPWDEMPVDEDEGLNTVAVENLAQLARKDPDCEVTLLGFE